MGKVIAIVNQKGGVGKTTTAVNLAAALGLCGKRTLLIDIDLQGNSTSGIGVKKKGLALSSYDVLIGTSSAEEATLDTPFENLRIVPASADLAGAEIEMADVEHRESSLDRAVSLIREDYDYILLDCPPSLGIITINALTAADSVIIPVQCEYYALEGLSQLISIMRIVKQKYNEHLDIEGVLLTMYDGRLNLTHQVVEEIKKFFPRKVFATAIPRTVRLSEAPSFGEPIQYYDRGGKGARAYNDLAEEIIKKR